MRNRLEIALTIGTGCKDQDCEDDLHNANRKNEVHVDICGWRLRGAIDEMDVWR
jgi:hypothetical protein